MYYEESHRSWRRRRAVRRLKRKAEDLLDPILLPIRGSYILAFLGAIYVADKLSSLLKKPSE
jgi:hypothetical protein